MAYTAQPSLVCYNDVTDENSTPEKGNVRRIVGKQSGLYRRNLSVFHSPAHPCCRRNKEKERKQSNVQKSYEKDRQLKRQRLPEKQIAMPEKFSGGASLFS